MQTVRILQAVVLMTLLALAASCAVTKAYTAKVFRPSAPPAADSTAREIRFLAMGDSSETDSSLVSTDLINGRDTTAALAGPSMLSQPAVDSSAVKKDTVARVEPVILATRENPVAKPDTRGSRQKRTRGQ